MVDDVRKINLFILAELEKRLGNWERLPTREQRIGDIFAKLVSLICQISTRALREIEIPRQLLTDHKKPFARPFIISYNLSKQLFYDMTTIDSFSWRI